MKVTTQYCDFCGTEIKDNLRGRSKYVDIRIVSTQIQSYNVDTIKEQWQQEAANDSSEVVITVHGWFDEKRENFEICPACYKRIKALRFKNKNKKEKRKKW